MNPNGFDSSLVIRNSSRQLLQSRLDCFKFFGAGAAQPFENYGFSCAERKPALFQSAQGYLGIERPSR
jgi:hypothetical protein